MNRHALLLAFGLAAAAALVAPLTLRAEDPSKLTQSGSVWKHAASKTTFAVPEGWQVGTARKLPDNGVTFGIDRDNPRIAVTLYWVPLGDRAWKEIVGTKEDPTHGYGVEHRTLAQLYGKDKVGKPELVKVGEREFYKITVDSGPGKSNDLAGLLYVFEVGKGDDRFRVKLRATFPKEGRDKHAETVEALLKQYEFLK